MFERATVFSSIFVFILFGILGYKYHHSIESKNQVNSISVTAEPKQN